MDIKRFIIDGKYNKIPVLEEKLKSQNDFKFLDIGCQSPLNLITLYHQFGVKSLYGIEKSEINDAFTHFINSIVNQDLKVQLSNCQSFFDIYEHIIAIDESCAIQNKLNEIEFQERILDRICYEMDMIEFFKSNNEKYDLIIASNVLKFVNSINELEFLIKKIKDSTTENGIIYFRTQPEFAHWKSYSSYKKILEKYFKNYTLIDTERVLENEMVSYFYNINPSEINV